MFLDITLPFSNGSLDLFVAWAGNGFAIGNTNLGTPAASSGISKQLHDFGWTQTVDTGQVDWSTIAAVPASMTGGVAVYEIWKFTDSNATNCPVFMKIEYGSAASDLPGLALTFGTGSDGAGTITGNTSTRELLNGMQNTTSNDTGFSCLFYSNRSGSASTMTRFSMALWQTQNSPYGPAAIMVERSHDNVGADTDLYFTYIVSNYMSGVPIYQCSIFKPTSTFGTTGIREGAAATIGGANATTTYNVGTNTPVLPIFPLVGWLGNPLVTYQAMKSGDASDGGTITAKDAYGNTHTYITLRKASGAYAFNYFSNIQSGNGALALLWE